MKNKNFVISNTPAKLPIQSTILYSFLLYYFNVDNLWWGIFITLMLIWWAISFYAIFHQVIIDLNSNKLDENLEKIENKSNFVLILQNLIKEFNKNK
jgi:hypothetical protein